MTYDTEIVWFTVASKNDKAILTSDKHSISEIK